MKETLETCSRIAKKLIFPILALLLLVLLLKQLDIYDRITTLYHAIMPLISGIIIAILFQPVIDKLNVKLNHKFAVAIIYFGILVAVLLFAAFLIPVLWTQVIDISSRIPQWLSKLQTFLNQYHMELPDITSIEKMFMKDGYGIVLDSVVSWMNAITRFAIGYMCGFFISMDLEFWVHSMKKIIPDFHRFTTFYKTMSNIIYQYLSGTLIDMLFIIATVGIVLYIVSFPNALFYAVMMALLNLWPYIGASIGLVIILGVSVLSYEQIPYIALIIIWVIQQIESNIIQPLIFNRTMDVRPILTFASLFICEALMGVAGVILSPIFAAIAQIVFRSYLHAKTSDEVGRWEDIWYDFDEVMEKIHE